jgi:hypothetical protein
MTLTVTVVDNETGDTKTAQVPDGDYLILATDPAKVHVQAYASGTHVLTVTGRKPGFGPAYTEEPDPLQPLIDDLHAEFDQGHMKVSAIVDRHRSAWGDRRDIRRPPLGHAGYRGSYQGPDRRVKDDPDVPQWEERRGRPAGGGLGR